MTTKTWDELIARQVQATLARELTELRVRSEWPNQKLPFWDNQGITHCYVFHNGTSSEYWHVDEPAKRIVCAKRYTHDVVGKAEDIT